jgi:hypothetical protein
LAWSDFRRSANSFPSNFFIVVSLAVEKPLRVVICFPTKSSDRFRQLRSQVTLVKFMDTPALTWVRTSSAGARPGRAVRIAGLASSDFRRSANTFPSHLFIVASLAAEQPLRVVKCSFASPAVTAESAQT